MVIIISLYLYRVDSNKIKKLHVPLSNAFRTKKVPNYNL